MKHSVVIGGAGFVGSWVVDEILKDPNVRVTIVDNLISSEKSNISTDPRVNFIEGSASDINVLKSIQDKVDYVYQLACFHGNQSSIARPLDDLENGLKTTLVTLEWVKTSNPQARVIYSGAGCAVAEKTWDSPQPIKEIDKTSLIHDSPYSITKIAGEMYCLFYANQHNLDVVRVRFQNVYGPREILGAGVWRGTENTIWRNVIPTFIYKAINDIDFEIFGEVNASRDFTYVTDVSRAVVLVANNGKSGQVYNIASGKETFINDVAEMIINLSDSKSKIGVKPRRSWDNSGRRFGDVLKIQTELGFTNLVSIEQGIKDTILWTKLNLDVINTAKDKFGSTAK
jgi:nucleoside-diphosphate-sugar epimerase